MLSLTFYGGVGEIGGNKVLLEAEDCRLFFDFGTPFALREQYFEEFLNPRSGAGLTDFLDMGLLPPLRGIYRQDMAQPELWQRFSTSALYRELEIDAVLLSHAHLDHCGYISFLKEDIPIYATAMTAIIAKAIQDSGKSDIEHEICYSIPREFVIPPPARSGAWKSVDYRRGAAVQRAFRLFDYPRLSDQARDFWKDKPGARELPPSPLLPAANLPALTIRHFPVDHSVFGACALGVETSSGWVIYSGDLRHHGSQSQLTHQFMEEASRLKPLLFIGEGTNIPEGSGASEEQVYEKALQVVQGVAGLVIADFGPRNIERLLIFRQIAQETGRKLVVLPRDAYLLRAMNTLEPSVPDLAADNAFCIYEEGKTQLGKWELAIRQDYRSLFVTAEEISRHQSDYILCFSFFDINELPSIQPRPGGVYIYSSSEAHNEEQKMDLQRLHNWLQRFGLQPVGLPRKRLGWKIPPEELGLHASGHASASELVDIITTIGPRYYLPIHCQRPRFFQQALRGTVIKVITPQLGQPMRFP